MRPGCPASAQCLLCPDGNLLPDAVWVDPSTRQEYPCQGVQDYVYDPAENDKSITCGVYQGLALTQGCCATPPSPPSFPPDGCADGNFDQSTYAPAMNLLVQAKVLTPDEVACEVAILKGRDAMVQQPEIFGNAFRLTETQALVEFCSMPTRGSNPTQISATPCPAEQRGTHAASLSWTDLDEAGWDAFMKAASGGLMPPLSEIEGASYTRPGDICPKTCQECGPNTLTCKDGDVSQLQLHHPVNQ